MKIKAIRHTLLLLALLLLGLVALHFSRDTASDFRSDGLLRVCIDAGHGGSDPGAVAKDPPRQEKDDCLSVALAVEAALHDQYPHIEVLLTRRDDAALTLAQRCSAANDFRADLFVSIHRNSAPTAAEGVEIWIPAGKPAADKKLAQTILDALADVGVSDIRGVKSGTASNPDGNYYVLGNTDMPSCLIELGFISSPADNALLDRHLADYARAIADSIAQLLPNE